MKASEIRKVHCFFEQSGTFKNEFIKLGIPAEDYDIQNNFGQTDHVIDLFGEIEKEYDYQTRQDKTRQDKTRQDNCYPQPQDCQVVVLGQMDNTLDHTFESANRVYDKNQLCPTIPTCAGGGIQPKVIEETKCVGGLSDDKWGGQFHQQDRVYKGDIALAQPANLPQGSYKYIVAMRGRGEMNEQKLEPNTSGTTNALTTVQKDNLCLEIKQATKDGTIKCKVGGCYDASFPNSTTRRGRVQEDGDVTPTLTAGNNENIHYIETQYRIRKLTPRECWRLMGYTDEDFNNAEKVNSNTQLYKQAGNAIVKQVLMAIFAQMIPESARQK